MKSSTKVYLLLITRVFLPLIIISVNMFILTLNGHDYRAITICRKASEGEPYRYTREFSGAAALTDFCVKENYVYLLFEGTGVLKVYDLSGKYLHSYAFYTESGGRSELHVTADRVYLEDQSGDVYSFANGEFERYYERDSANCPNQFRDDLKRGSSDGVQYKRKWASIVALTPEGVQKTIISRPFFHVFFDPKASYTIHFLAFIYLVVIHFGSRRNHNAGQ